MVNPNTLVLRLILILYPDDAIKISPSHFIKSPTTAPSILICAMPHLIIFSLQNITKVSDFTGDRPFRFLGKIIGFLHIMSRALGKLIYSFHCWRSLERQAHLVPWSQGAVVGSEFVK